MSDDTLAEARRATTARPPEMRRENLWSDIGYVLGMFGRYFAVEPVAGPLLVVVMLGFSALGGYLLVATIPYAGGLMDALVAHRAASVWYNLFAGFAVGLGYVLCLAISSAATFWLRIRWRTVFTERFLGKWFADDRFYHLDRRGVLENPEQRIQEDLFLIIDNATQVLPAITSTISRFFAGAALLLSLSSTFSFEIVGLHILV